MAEEISNPIRPHNPLERSLLPERSRFNFFLFKDHCLVDSNLRLMIDEIANDCQGLVISVFSLRILRVKSTKKKTHFVISLLETTIERKFLLVLHSDFENEN